ncbi:hypothetical protein ABID47_004800 [Paenibacillus favisporus]|uniref:Uncharacterized protein n=1 Tax=Paenibacillus favisporus TaxID=221028 RepID=A0ABV2F930_9BACL
MSLKNTVIVANISPAPIDKNNNINKGTHINNIVAWNFIFVTSMITKIGNIAIRVVIKEEHTLESGKKYLGTYTFLINWLLALMESIEKFVASEKKE